VAIDLNADLGEEAGLGGTDVALLAVVTSAHIACGFHAGDPSAMRRTVQAAVEAGVVVGAHPSYADREGFGRRPVDRSPIEVADDVAYQIGALQGIARGAGGTVRSVKPHGALYNRVADDEVTAAAVAGAVRDAGDALVLVLPAGSPALAVASGAGVAVAAEGFCDRGYLADGSLAPRDAPGGVVTEPDVAAARAVALATGRPFPAIDGTSLELRCDTLCVHGDTPGSHAIALAVRRALAEAGVEVRPFAR